MIEFSLKLGSNPEFTSSVLVAYARAAYKLNKAGDAGCKTVLDIPPAMLTLKSYEEIIKENINKSIKNRPPMRISGAKLIYKHIS